MPQPQPGICYAAEPFGENPRFVGFDGNNETRHMSVGRLLVEQMGRFQRFNDRSLNSHSPSIDGYLLMYELFAPLRPQMADRTLTVQELAEFLIARRFPD